MQVVNCPDNWEYEKHANYYLLPIKCIELLISLRSNTITTAIPSETRLAHRCLFSMLTPQGLSYFAGCYRGCSFQCLKYYEVQIKNDPRVGTKTNYVQYEMQLLSKVINDGMVALDVANQIPNAQLAEEDKIYFVVTFACKIFVEFLRIHPYANGNGHIGRYIIWAILGKYGIWPKQWPMHDRPPDPPYSSYISTYRNGNQTLLEEFVLKCVLGTA